MITIINIRPGDIVEHIPTGEEWVVCGVNNEHGELIPCGYPFPTLAKISDCVLKKACGIPQPQEYKDALLRHGMSSFIEKELSRDERV